MTKWWKLILVLSLLSWPAYRLNQARPVVKPPIPGLCTPPPCAGTLVCADDSGCDCTCFPGAQ